MGTRSPPGERRDPELDEPRHLDDLESDVDEVRAVAPTLFAGRRAVRAAVQHRPHAGREHASLIATRRGLTSL
ncbi:hypothetical protein AB0383_09175 [Amycolatopsis sp. NPDC051373]|uniref:hypothetical protein n=1 Tax=Amycolatopsis sp. NPDC051373 TaxID=3155801 RepID=UPI00344D22A9